MVKVPVPLLLDPALSPSAKLVSIALRLNGGRPNPAQLAVLVGLTEPTVRKGLNLLASHPPSPATPIQTVAIPKALLAIKNRVGEQAKLLYGILQLTPGNTTYTGLCALTGISRNTAKQALAELQTAGWVQVEAGSQRDPLAITLLDPVAQQVQHELDLARQHIEEAPIGHREETIMREFLNLLVAADHSEDDVEPGWLYNPFTNKLMQLDRFYPPNVAFEYNGPQHYGPTKVYPSEHKARRQYARDKLKQALCADRGVTLVIVHKEDLSLQGMRQKVGRLLPLRNLAGYEPLITLLERAGR